VTRGRKLRCDGTVVATNIHYPTDSSLLNDGVRVLSRTIGRAKQLLGDLTDLGQAAFRDRTRSAKRHAKRIEDAIRKRTEDAQAARQTAYQQLIRITTASVKQARQVGTALKDQASRAARQLAEQLSQMLPRVEQVIEQTRRRVLVGEQVGASEKIVSLFEPETAIIRKDPRPNRTAFGRLIWLSEVEGGIISRYAVLSGNPDEAAELPPSLDHHIELFGKPPRLLAGDRKLATAANERYATKQQVKQVVLPKAGAKSARRSAHERQRWFRRGRNWRAGIEGRISGLKRGQGLSRCRYHGDDGMERWVGLALIAHDLRTIAQARAA
jgi:IS5 family transposase